MKSRTLVILIILICGGITLAAIAVCAGFFFFFSQNVESTLSPKIDALFAHIDKGTFGKNYFVETTPEFQSVTSKKDYEKLGVIIKSNLGRLKSKTLQQYNAQQFTTNSFVEVIYSATFEKGEGTIRVRFKKVNGDWRLLNFFVNSPAFVKNIATQSCPHCRESCQAEAKFCPSCGKAMKDRDEGISPKKKEGNQKNHPATKEL
jgi:hypothetical protein